MSFVHYTMTNLVHKYSQLYFMRTVFSREMNFSGRRIAKSIIYSKFGVYKKMKSAGFAVI